MTAAPPSPPGLTFYPASHNVLSPTFNTWVKFTAADVHGLEEREGFEGQNIYFHLNHPIRYVRLVGVLVALEDYPRRTLLTLDDCSGATIEIVWPKRPPPSTPLRAPPPAGTPAPAPPPWIPDPPLDGIDLGSVIKAKGTLSNFRGARQLLLKRAAVIGDTNEEVRAWRELSTFRAEVLAAPWVVDEEAARRLAEGPRRRRPRRRKRRTEEGGAR
ncbi:MAG: hypothetical protein M1832_001119 [Thelocarpon impressellum]|nr:MAG: hypothetical protein M1832_001119 [Thelocarpon impressellum]